MTTITYNSHLLLGQKHVGDAVVLKRWDHAPKVDQVREAIQSAERVFVSFVLVAPCGPALPGNFEMTTEQLWGM